jgi:hypothetical protein
MPVEEAARILGMTPDEFWEGKLPVGDVFARMLENLSGQALEDTPATACR